MKKKQLYGHTNKSHHVFCNYWSRVGECDLCDQLYAKYPVENPNTSDAEIWHNLVNKHFPDVHVKE